MEREIPATAVWVILLCDKCQTEINTEKVSAQVVDGKKVIPTKCLKCGDETQQSQRYPYVKYMRVPE